MAKYPSAADVNVIATFLAHEQIKNLEDVGSVDCIVLCVSAIFHCAKTVFSALKAHSGLAKTLVICGGIGHSTPFLYDAVAKNPEYSFLHSKIEGLPESQVLQVIYENCYRCKEQNGNGFRILIEDKSTNCGANAIETRRILEANDIETPKSVIVVQDPTMSRRTVASFEKAYSDIEHPPIFHSCPTFVPTTKYLDGRLVYDSPGVRSNELWDIDRFLGLISGEIPRLRDDHDGYGPHGQGFIVHVDIPTGVEESYAQLKRVIPSSR
ncbi:hypothetical protein MBLNU459_g6523t2 [Dothideomycetes sp. NU459]